MVDTFDQRQEAYWANNTNLRRYDHPVVRAFAQQRVEYIKTILGSWRPRNTLDVGCGDGFGMHYMQPLVGLLYGCDRSAKMLEANPANDIYLKQCDAYALPYEDSQFELVYCWELLHHIGDPQKVVREMTRVASKCVILCEPNCLNPAMALYGLIKPEERGLLQFTPSYTKKLLRNAGLNDVRDFTVGWFPPNRTPEWLAKILLKLPYRIPVVSMYTIALGYIPASDE